MRRRQARTRAFAAALAGGLAFNVVALALFLLGAPHIVDRRVVEPSRAIEVTLASRRAPSRSASPTSAEPRTVAGRRAAPVPNPQAIAGPSPSASPAATDRPAPAPAPAPPVPAGDGSIEAARAVLRHLRDCAPSSAQDRAGVRCATSLGAADLTISGVSDARRAEFDAARRRRDDLLATHGALEQNLLDTRGSAARAGCVYSGGKWRCGSY